MKTLLWTHTEKDGEIIIREAGLFSPRERIVEIDISEEDSLQDIFDKIKHRYSELNIPLEYKNGNITIFNP